MMYKTLFIAILCMWAYTGKAQSHQKTGIHFFKGSWAEVLQASNETGKPIFVDAYAVWCGPCKWMDRNTFKDSTVAAFYNANFINYKFDMEKGEGRKFSTTYKIAVYPTLLYLNAKGEVKHREMGGKRAEQFIELGKKALNQFDLRVSDDKQNKQKGTESFEEIED